MARDDDRSGIASVGLADRLKTFGAIDGHGDIAIAAGFSIRNRQQRLPDFELKRRTDEIERDVEVETFSGKVLPKLMFCGADDRAGCV